MVKVRVELVSDVGANRGTVVSGVVVETSYDHLLKAVQNKLQLRKKDLASVVLCVKGPFGVSVLPRGDLSASLNNGDTVQVSSGRTAEEAERAVAMPAEQALSKVAKKGLQQLHWVEAGRGHLAARGCPSTETLAALSRFGGATCLVTLLREDERGSTVGQLGDACGQLGVRWCHAPLSGVAGLRRPELSPGDRSGLATACQVRDWLMSDGERVVVHCAAGLHRTGVYLYCVLRLLGESPEGALGKLREIREQTYTEFVRLSFQHQAEQAVAQLAGVGSAEAAIADELGVPAQHQELDPDDDETYDEEAGGESDGAEPGAELQG